MVTTGHDGGAEPPNFGEWLKARGADMRRAARPNDAVPRPTPERPDAAHADDDAAPRLISDPAAYARRALDTAVENITGADEGFRNHTLNAAAYSLGRLVGAGLLDEATAADALRSAAEEVGLEAREIPATIASGLGDGISRPLAWVQGAPTAAAPVLTPFVVSVTEGYGNAGTAWCPVDIRPVLDGTYTAPMPTVAARDDGVGMFYPGRLHSLASEAEAGKTWLALAAVRCEIERGNGAAFLDFEDDERGVVGRLLAIGAKPVDLRGRFAYIAPDAPLDERGQGDLLTMLGDLHPSLVVIDGVSEAMALHGLEINDAGDVVRFGRMLARWLADRGPAVLLLDHVTKNPESRGRYALGSAHKLNGLNGAAYLLENRRPFGIGMLGRSTLRIAKDRPGELRRHAFPGGDRPPWFADLVVESLRSGHADVSLSVPVEHHEEFRPTVLMGRVAAAVSAAAGPLSQRDIFDRVTGKSEALRRALACLIDEGYLAIEDGARGARLHRLVREFDGETP